MTEPRREGKVSSAAKLFDKLKELQKVALALRENSNLSVIAALRLKQSYHTTFDEPVTGSAKSLTKMSRPAAADEEESKPRKLSTAVINESTRIVQVFEELETLTGRTLLSVNSPKQLTSDGEEFLRKSLTLFNTFDDLISSGARTTVHVSCIDMAGNFWIPEALGQTRFFEQPENAHVNLRLRVREWHEVQDDVRLGLADFGIGTTMSSGGVESRPLLYRPHVLLAHQRLPWLPEGAEMPISGLQGKRIAVLRSYIAPVDVEMNLRQNDVHDFSIIEAFTSAQLLSFVREGVAVAFITPDVFPLTGPIRIFRLTGVTHRLSAAADSIYVLPPEVPRMPTPAAQRMLQKIENYWHDAQGWLERRGLADLVEDCRLPAMR